MRFLFFLQLASIGIVYFQKNFHISQVLVLAPRLIFAGIQYRYKLGSSIGIWKVCTWHWLGHMLHIDLEFSMKDGYCHFFLRKVSPNNEIWPPKKSLTQLYYFLTLSICPTGLVYISDLFYLYLPYLAGILSRFTYHLKRCNCYEVGRKWPCRTHPLLYTWFPTIILQAVIDGRFV
jgi:hypothetical protein